MPQVWLVVLALLEHLARLVNQVHQETPVFKDHQVLKVLVVVPVAMVILAQLVTLVVMEDRVPKVHVDHKDPWERLDTRVFQVLLACLELMVLPVQGVNKGILEDVAKMASTEEGVMMESVVLMVFKDLLENEVIKAMLDHLV